MKHMPGLDGNLTPQARAVIRAFTDAQTRAIGFLLSTGVFPEVSESGSEKLHDVVRDLALRHLGQRRLDRALRRSLVRCARSTEARDQIEAAVNAMLASEATAAYLFGLAAGLNLGRLDEALKSSLRSRR